MHNNENISDMHINIKLLPNLFLCYEKLAVYFKYVTLIMLPK